MLTATSGRWSGLVGSVSYSYQWERCGEGGEGCSTITGATASTYTLTESDVASTLRVLVDRDRRTREHDSAVERDGRRQPRNAGQRRGAVD